MLPWLALLPLPSPAAPAHLPLQPIVVEIPEATLGPPEQSCEEALALAKEDLGTRPKVKQPATTDPVESQRPPPPKPTSPLEEEPDMVIVDVTNYVFSQLPGSDPTELPPQPLEGSDRALLEVGNVMRKAEAGGRVRMSFFGASHTEGDFWTGQLRRQLQQRYGDIGHGFVLPAELESGYRAHDVNLCRTTGWRSDYVGRRGGRGDGLYGFAGASVSSADPADFGWTETTRTNALGRLVSRYDIFTLAQPSGGSLLVTVDEVPPRAIPTAAGAIGLQVHRVLVPEGPHRLTLQPLGDGEVRIFGVSAEREGPGVLVDAMGVRGRTARTILEWNEDLLHDGLAVLDPDLVVLAYGTNEANDSDYDLEAYRHDLRLVVEKMRRAVPDAACILVGPSDRGVPLDRIHLGIWPRTELFAQVQREVAPEYGCAFWDWQRATGGPGSMIAWRLHPDQLAGKDLIHFTQRGYELSADLFLAALDQVAVETGVTVTNGGYP